LLCTEILLKFSVPLKAFCRNRR